MTTKYVLVLVCLWSLSGGEDLPNLLADSSTDVIPEGLFELPLATNHPIEETLRPKPRSLLEPRELDGGHRPRPARPVRYSGEKLCEGACITPRACQYHQGTTKGQCSNGNVCCIFQKSCGGVSREKVSFFRSPQYPISLNESLECSYRIYPSENTCALRIDFEKFELKKPKRYVKVEKCVDDVMFLMNSAHGSTEGICEMENHTAVVEVEPSSSHPIILLFVAQSHGFSWSLKVTQINCKKMEPWKNLSECGRQLVFEPNEYDSDSQLSALENPFRPATKQSHFQLLTPYIVNGKDAETREFPWQASLQLKSKSSHRCGGSIINERFILTAAHCVYRNAYLSKDKLKVVVGDYILDTETDGSHNEFDVEQIIVHYNYKPTESHINDIAVLKLNGTIKFNDKVQPVCLLSKDYNLYNKNAVLSGWGRLNGSDPAASATVLQKLNVKIISNAECKELVKKEYEEVLQKNLTYDEVGKSSIMGRSDTQLCGISRSNTSVCFGDSGGPLVIQNEENGRYFQAGVVSYGIGKCRTDRQIPGSYTNVQKYLTFITVATMEQK